MAKQGKGDKVPPPDDPHPEDSDILEVVPVDEPPAEKPKSKQTRPDTQLAGPDWVEASDLVDDLDVVEEVAEVEPVGEAPPPPPLPSKLEQTEVLIEDLKEQPVPAQESGVEPAAAFEEVHEVDLWEDEPAGVEVIEPPKDTIPAEAEAAASPKSKTPPDDVAGADDFVEIIDLAAVESPELHAEDLLIDATPGPQPAPTGKGGVARTDKIAEALESGSDLTGEKKALQQPPAVVTAEVDYASDLDKGGESSAVDLGQPAPRVRDKAAEVDSFEAAAAEEEPLAFAATRQTADDEGPMEVAATEEDEPPAGRRKPAAEKKERPAGKPGFGLRWVAGILIGLVVAGGALVGMAFTMPDLTRGLLGLKEEKKTPPVARPTPLQQAHTAMDHGDYDEAIQQLQAADKSSPEDLSVRGEAHWLKYLKEQKAKKAPLNEKAPEVQLALKDAREANNDLLQMQIQKTLEADGMSKNLATLRQSEQTLAAVRKSLLNLSSKDPQAKDLVQTTAELAQTLRQNRQTLEGLRKVFEQNKQLPPDQQLTPEALAAMLAKLTVAQKNLSEVETLLKVKGNQVAQNVAQLVSARKQLDEKLAEIDKQLTQAKVPGAGAQGVSELVAAKSKLEAERGQLDSVVKQAIQELEAGKFLPAGATVKDLVAGVKAARERSDSPLAAPLNRGISLVGGLGEQVTHWLQKAADKGLLQTEVAFYRLREPLIKTPENRLDTWIARLLSGPPSSPSDVDEAKRDADWVLGRAGNVPIGVKLKAELVRALVEKNHGKLVEARAALERVVKDAAGLDPAPAWVAEARQAEKQLSDAPSYYLPAARDLLAQGRWQDALAKLDEGLKAMPNNGRLLALRSEARLQMSGNLRKDEAAKLLGEARKEAEAATKDPASAAEAYFSLGRIEEAHGNLAKAEENYRQALKTHQGSPEAASRYRAALGRVILMRLDESPVDVPTPKEVKTGLLNVSAAFRTLMLTVVTGVAGGGDDPADAKRLQEALDLANELLKSENREDKGNGHLLLGKIYTRQGKRTEGLREYVVGLQLLYPGLVTKDLARMIDEHPAFQQPDSLGRASVSVASMHYGLGLQRFWDRQYPQAEEELKKAVANYPEDARYRYFLGLARYMQKNRAKRETAVFDFEQAARLERQNRPDSVAVNSSFERLPYELRQMLGRYRQKTPAPPAEETVGR